MLKFFSRLEKTRNFLMMLVVIVMVASLVLIGRSLFDTPGTARNFANSTQTAAKVGSEVITVGEVATQKENLAQNPMFGGRSIGAKPILNSLVSERITRLEVNRLGLTASDAEVADEARQRYTFTYKQPFDQKVYEQRMTEQYGSIKTYEQEIRDQIGAKKLEAYLTSGVTVSEAEVLDDFKRRNTNFDLSFVSINPTELATTLKPTDEELKAYFEQNKKNYTIGVQKKIRYIFINTTKIGEKVTISDEDLKAEYDKLAPAYKQSVNGQQIVLKIPKPEEETQTLAKANEIIEKTKKDGATISEEAFAELAKGYSQDTASALNGGKLPGLVRLNPANPNDPYQKLLTLEEGQVSEPIKSGSAYYILRRGTAVPRTFEEAKKGLEVTAKTSRAYKVGGDLAQKVSERLKEVKDVQKVAEEFAAQANSTAKEMVRETDFIKLGDEVPNIGVSPQFEEGIAPLEEVGSVGERTPIKEGFAVPMLIDKREARDATFEEVKDRVAEAVRNEQAKSKIEQIAKDIAAGANNAAAIAAAATGKGLKAEDSTKFILGSPLGKSQSAGTSKELEDTIFNLKAGEVAKTPIKVGDNWYVVGVTNRTEANLDEIAKERDQILQGLLATRRSKVFSDFLAEARQKLEAAGQIKIYKDAIEKLDAADREAEKQQESSEDNSGQQ
jgi:peptidyl-prolyl cis-trans isomerase D